MCASTNVGLELFSYLQIETFDDVPLLQEAVNRLICWSKDYVVVNIEIQHIKQLVYSLGHTFVI